MIIKLDITTYLTLGENAYYYKGNLIFRCNGSVDFFKSDYFRTVVIVNVESYMYSNKKLAYYFAG